MSDTFLSPRSTLANPLTIAALPGVPVIAPNVSLTQSSSVAIAPLNAIRLNSMVFHISITEPVDELENPNPK